MAYLEIKTPSGHKNKFSIYKRITTVGGGDEVDIKIDTDENIVAYINQNIDGFFVLPKSSKAHVTKNNKALKDGEIFFIKEVSFTFFKDDLVKDEEQNLSEVVAYSRMLEFSRKIAEEKDIEKLLNTLLKEIIQLTKAEYGFLFLIEENKPAVKVKASTQDEHEWPNSPISDSIVKKVIEQKKALVVSDALNDREFKSSLSVINYRLTSIMCAPLICQGRVIGAIYVGNNSFVSAFDQKSLELMTIYSGQAALLVQNALHINALKKHTKSLQESLEQAKFGGMIGSCQGMQEIFSQVEKVSVTDVSVLIGGEYGTGKELIAQEIHNRSIRKNNAFVTLNCKAVSEDLLERELFGYVRGAFSGASKSQIGKFQKANNGTLLLLEIEHAPISIQTKLLATIKEQRVTKIGGSVSDHIDTRVLFTTLKDLASLVKQGKFLSELYYWLSVVRLYLPPLRERGNDILVIANYLMQKYSKIYGKEVSGLEEEAQNVLLNYHWPGNVRQLENIIRRAVVMCEYNKISAHDLAIKDKNDCEIMPLSVAVDRFRERYISESLERNAGNRTKTANELGVDPRTIFRYLEGQKRI